MANNEKALSKIMAMLSNEGIAFTDKGAALKSISEAVLPTKLTKIYLQELERINDPNNPTNQRVQNPTSNG